MTLPRPVLVSSSDPAPASGQKSCANPLDLPPQGGRGRDRRGQRGRDVGFYLRRNMPALWGQYVRGSFASREDCAAHFGVAFQTAYGITFGLRTTEGPSDRRDLFSGHVTADMPRQLRALADHLDRLGVAG